MTAIAAAFVVQAPAASAAPIGFVHRQGTNLVDGQNRPLLMNGVNLGGYLLWEGWIFGGGPTSETGRILDRLRSFYGGPDSANDPKTSDFQRRVQDNFITRADMVKMKSVGVNTIRVPVNYRLIDSSNDGFRTLDRIVADAKAVGLYVVIDLHGAPGSQNGGFISDPAISLNAQLWADNPAGVGFRSHRRVVAQGGDPLRRRDRYCRLRPAE